MVDEALRQRFNRNLGRVEAVYKSYDESRQGAAGRASVADTELLRYAVVLLHAALEDLLRGVAEARLPAAGSAILAAIPLARSGQKPLERFHLGDLADQYRTATVQQVIDAAVQARLKTETYNNPGQIKALLRETGLDAVPVDAYAASLGAMNARRHQIVHRADTNSRFGRGHHAAVPLDKSTVQAWLAAVRGFGSDLLAALPVVTAEERQ